MILDFFSSFFFYSVRGNLGFPSSVWKNSTGLQRDATSNQHVWNELERRRQAEPYRQNISVGLADAAVVERDQVSAARLQNSVGKVGNPEEKKLNSHTQSFMKCFLIFLSHLLLVSVTLLPVFVCFLTYLIVCRLDSHVSRYFLCCLPVKVGGLILQHPTSKQSRWITSNVNKKHGSRYFVDNRSLLPYCVNVCLNFFFLFEKQTWSNSFLEDERFSTCSSLVTPVLNCNN